MDDQFKTALGEHTFYNKYALTQDETWHQRAITIVDYICGTAGGNIRAILSEEERQFLVKMITTFKFMPGGRYIYYAGRKARYYNNCYLFKGLEDTKEEWASLNERVTSSLMTGGGIGIDYSIFRPSGRLLTHTGGQASGPIPLMSMINEIGRNVMQGGSRRSAIFASLNWRHEDVGRFLAIKNWKEKIIGPNDYSVWDAKQFDFNFPGTLDMTNISLNYDDTFLRQRDEAFKTGSPLPEIFMQNIRQALSTGEPGFSFNFGDKENETLRNAPVAGDTMVLTDCGYQRVYDILNEPVTVWTGKQWAPTIFNRTKEFTPTLRVNMTGGRSITCDPSHEFLVERWKGAGPQRKMLGIDRVSAMELTKDDVLHVSLPSVEVVDFNSRDYTVGYAYGDGSFNKYGGGEITLCTDESKSCLSLFEESIISSVTENDRRGYTRLYLKTRTAVGAVKSIFPENVSASFIAGLFDADGSDSSGYVRLASVHRGFLEGVQRWFEQHGILSSINRAGISTYGKKQGWMLVIMKEFHENFAILIPTNLVKDIEFGSYRKSVIRVSGVEQDVDQDVYCCDVGVEEHSFQASGVIISNCGEVVSEDDSDVCNLGSVNIGAIENIEEFKEIVHIASKFLVCGTVRAALPSRKIREVREKNRRLGLGLMGMHEWLLKRGHGYEVGSELKEWLEIYRDESEVGADEHCDRLYLSRPAGYRAIAPTGTIGIIAGTTTGIEPLYAVAYKRRYLTDGDKWKYEFVVDRTAQILISEYGLKAEDIDTALELAKTPEKRIVFQADVQEYVDMAISSTINLPEWGTKYNNEGGVDKFAKILAKHAHRLRGFTCYPDSSRGGQPLTVISYEEAMAHKGTVFDDNDTCKGGSCGL